MSSEAVVSQQTELLLARLGALPMRNNVGVAFDESSRAIRYGLMNKSKEQNKEFKSSDWIAPVPILITPQMVGQTIAVFGAFETKWSGWHLTAGDERGQAQQRFINLVNSVGGRAGFVTDPADVYRILYGAR